MRTMLVLLVVTACSTPDECPAPKKVMYSCEPVPAGTVGCVGPCVFNADLPLQEAAGGQDPADAGRTFPVGCVTTLPFCAPLCKGEVQTCECVQMGSGSAMWTYGL